MAVSSTTSKITYNGNGSTTAFATPYFINNSDLIVVLRDANGAETTQTISTHYTLSGAGTEAGGTVTMLTAPASGYQLVIYRDPPITQTTDYNDQDEFPASTTERSLDKHIMIDQRLKDLINRALRLKETDTLGAGVYQANSQRITGVAAGTTSSDAVNLTQVQAYLTNLTQYATSGILAIYGTRDAAAAVSVPAAATFLLVSGYSAVGDYGAGLYKKLGSAPSPQKQWHFQSADGAWWQLAETSINPHMLGAVGNGTSDDRAAMQNSIDYLSTIVSGGILWLVGGKTYKCTITTGVTNRGLIGASNVRIVGYGATVNFDCTGNVLGLRFKSNFHIEGGSWGTSASASSGSQGISQAPLTVGEPYGEGGTVASPGTFQKVSGWSLKNVTISQQARSGGYGLVIYGGVNNGVVDGLTVADSATIAHAVSIEWNYVGADGSIDSANLTTINTSRTNFDAGTAYTDHPYNITVQNVKIGALTYSSGDGSRGIYLSAVHDVRVLNWWVDSCTGAGFYHHAGDLGYEFALAAIKPYRHKNVVCKSFTVADANNGLGCFADCYGDNLDLAIGLGYSARLSAYEQCGLVIEDFHTYSDAGASVLPGFRIQNITGVTLINPFATGHKQGILLEVRCKHARVIGGVVHSNREDGLLASHGSNPPEEVIIDGLQAYSNGINATSAGIQISATRVTVQNCQVGRAGENFQDYGIYISGGSGNKVINNHVLGISSGGKGIKIGDTTSYNLVDEYHGNAFSSGIAAADRYDGANIIPAEQIVRADGSSVRRFRASRSALSGDTTPTAGTFVAGDLIEFDNPAASGKIGSVCVTGGSPGTWKQYGAIDA